MLITVHSIITALKKRIVATCNIIKLIRIENISFVSCCNETLLQNNVKDR